MNRDQVRNALALMEPRFRLSADIEDVIVELAGVIRNQTICECAAICRKVDDDFHAHWEEESDAYIQGASAAAFVCEDFIRGLLDSKEGV